MKIYTYEELVALSNIDLDILVAKFHGWKAWPYSDLDEQGWKVQDGSTVHVTFSPLVFEDCANEVTAWYKAHESMAKPSTNGYAALRLLDELASSDGYQIDAEKDVSTVSPYGYATSGTRSIVLGKPSESLPRAITISWIFMKQMQAVPFKRGDAILHDNRTLHFENVDSDDPTVSWATDGDGKDYELKTSELVKA